MKSKDKKVVEETTTDQENINNFESDPAVPQLNLRDLSMTLKLLQVAIKRGTYEPNELQIVGTTYETISNFVTFQVNQRTEDSTDGVEARLKMLKHIGRVKSTGHRCIVVFRELHDKEGNVTDQNRCIVFSTENLQPTEHDDLIRIVESEPAQSTGDFTRFLLVKN